MNEINEINEITLEDVAKEPWEHLPPELQEKSKHLAPEEQHTVLELKEEGQGHNESLLSVAATMHRMGVSYSDAVKHLQSIYLPSRPDYNTAPQRAVNRVWKADGDMNQLADSEKLNVPDLDETRLLRFSRVTKSDLAEMSPNDRNIGPLALVKKLFSSDDNVNIQKTGREHGTLCKVSDLDYFLASRNSKMDCYKFLNPATFKNVKGIEKDGKRMTRCNDNVKSRDWIVLEMDDPDESARERFTGFALAMSEFAPLKMAVDTGGKSIHFWFDARQKVAKEVRERFFAIACQHGADKRMMVKSQIARMPNVSPENDKRRPQSVLYLDADESKYPSKAWDLRGWENVLKSGKFLDCYYKPGSTGAYFTMDKRGVWRSLDKSSLKIHLAHVGYNIDRLDGEVMSEVDDIIREIQNEKTVDLVYRNLCGRHSGFYEESGIRYLVTNSPSFIKEQKGSFPTIERILRGTLPDEYELELFLGWVSAAMKDLRNGGRRCALFRPAQSLFIAGTSGSGKSLILEKMIRPLLSGRMALADDYFKPNANGFNADLYEAELLALDDSPIPSSSHKKRYEFSEKMKSINVSSSGRLEKKGVDATSIRPWWRFVRCMNDGESYLATLPLFDDGVEDKWILLHSPNKMSHYWPGYIAEKVEEEIEKELNAFAFYLLHEHQVREECRDQGGRYPVRTYKNKNLLESIHEGSPEQTLMRHIDNDCESILFEVDDKPKDWEGTASDLFDILMTNVSNIQQMTMKQFTPNAKILASQLRQMEKDGNRVIYSERDETRTTKKNGVKYWIIKPPQVNKQIDSNNPF